MFRAQKHPLALYKGSFKVGKLSSFLWHAKFVLINVTLVTLSNPVTSIFQVSNRISQMIFAIITRFFRTNVERNTLVHSVYTDSPYAEAMGGLVIVDISCFDDALLMLQG